MVQDLRAGTPSDSEVPEWWGKSVLLTFAKVRRCKSATNISRHLKNGYVHKVLNGIDP
jgi:hypothetical protein